MDDAFRALERRALNQPDDVGAVAELERACARLQRDLPRGVLSHLGRWRTLAWFVDGWFRRGLDETSGCAPQVLDDAEARLGVRLPRALRELHLLVGRRPEVTDVIERLVRPDSWEVHQGHLLVLVSNEQRAGIRMSDREDDPPVQVGPVAQPLSAFMTSTLLTQNVMGRLQGGWMGGPSVMLSVLRPHVRGARAAGGGLRALREELPSST